MKIVSWNVNGIRACSKKGFIEFIEDYDPDILCIQETKAHPEQLNPELLNPIGRTGYFSSAQRRGYSGTASFFKPKIKPEVSHGIGIRKFDNEGRFLVSEYKNTLIYNVYFPNGASREERHLYKQEFLNKFTRHLQKKIEEGYEIILLGDYNVAYLECDVHDPVRLSKVSGFLPEERKWFQEFLTKGFTDVYRHFYPNEKDKYTWWSYRENARRNNRGWRIDHICVTPGLVKKVKQVEILDQQMGSDHCPIAMEIKI